MIQDRTFKDPQQEIKLYFSRLCVVSVAVVLMVGGLLWRYYQLQVVRHQDFVTQSENNRVYVRPVPPSRGLIYDRNGVLLADNRPGFSLSVVVERAGDLDALLGQLDRLLSLSEGEIQRFRDLLKRRRPYEAVPLRDNLTEVEQGILAVNEYRLPGVEVTARLIRHYPIAEPLAHVLGYVGRINETEIRELDPVRYSGTFVTGKTGLEKYYEDQLLGQVGNENVETNARGRVTRVLERTDPKPGEDLHLYLDVRLQQLAYQLLDGRRGAVVALEIDTGGVIALASAPGFDPNLFVTGISFEDYEGLVKSLDRPLFDRALQGQYPPGSTIKPIFGLAMLESGAVPPDYNIYDPGFYRLENDKHKYRDWKKGGHGARIDLYKAIVQSCDTFFYDIGVRMGIEQLYLYGTRFGLGQVTGIDMPSERRGIMPSKDWKRGARGLAWYPGDTVNASIGQGFVLATPLQLAVAAARLGSRGEIRVPRLVEAIDDEEWSESQLAGQIEISPDHWDTVLGAMRGVVHDFKVRGTARHISKGIDYEIAGKTGTAQVVGVAQEEEYDAEQLAERHLPHALFIAFAPVDKPRIALAVLVENGEHGSSTAAPVARTMIDAYLQYYPQPEEVALGTE